MTYKKLLVALFLFIGLLGPAVSMAQIGGTPPIFGGPRSSGSSIQDGLDQVPDELKSGRFGNAESVTDVVVIVIYIILGISGAVAVLFVVLGGFWWLTAGGSADQAKKGKAYLTNALIGTVVIATAYVAVNVVVNTVQRG